MSAKRGGLALLFAGLILTLWLAWGQSTAGYAQASRYFPQTGFAVTDDEIWDYFSDRGGVETFGYPVSEIFTYDGFAVQIFQRHVLQINGDLVRPLNLLDPEVMPIDSYGGLTFPRFDTDVAQQAPAPSTPDYGVAVQAYIDSAVGNQWQNEAVNFRDYYYSAAPADSGELRALIALEVWGFPTSLPAWDPNNSNFIYQRFQRGIMHYDKTEGVTWGILLGDAFKEQVNPTGAGGANPTSRTFYAGVEITRGGFNAERMNDAAAAGVTMVRASGIFWDQIEATRGSYNWAVMAEDEANMRLISAAGIAPLMIFRNTPTWARETPSHLCSAIRADALGDFANFVEAAVTRYSAAPYNVHHWEMFNEPDVDPALVGGESGFGCWGDIDDPYYNGDQYAAMLAAAYPVIKRVDPTATVYVGGLLLDCDPTNPPSNKSCDPGNFFEGILRAGGGAHFDVVAYHAYGLWNSQARDADFYHPDWVHRGGALAGKASFLREVMREYGVDKPLIMNEGGLLCDERNSECPSDGFYDDQARYLPKMMARAQSLRLQGAIWYTLNGPGWRQGGLLNRDGSPRPAYVALKQYNERLGAAQYVGVGSAAGFESYTFSRADRLITLYWVNSGTRTLTVPENAVALYDYLGQPIALTATLTVDSAPIYVEIQR